MTLTNPQGQPCPICGAALSKLSSWERQQCTGCLRYFEWPLKPGQAPLVTSNRDKRKS